MRGFLSIFGPALGCGLAASMLIVAVTVALGTRVHAQELSTHMPGFVCDTPADLQAAIKSRAAGATWYQAISQVNKSSLGLHEPPHCLVTHRLPTLRTVVDTEGEVLVDNRIFIMVGMMVFDLGSGVHYKYLLVPALEYGI